MDDSTTRDDADWTMKRRVGLWLGVGLFILIEALPAPEGMPAAGWHCAAVALLIAVWWGERGDSALGHGPASDRDVPGSGGCCPSPKRPRPTRTAWCCC